MMLTVLYSIAQDRRVDALERQNAAYEARLAHVEAELAGGGRVEDQQRQLASMEMRLAHLEKSLMAARTPLGVVGR